MVHVLSPVSEGASCRAGQVCRYPFRQSFKAPWQRAGAFFEKFCLQMGHVSHIISFVHCPAGVMELVDVADSKASKSGSMKSDKNLDFSRLPSYNKIWLL